MMSHSLVHAQVEVCGLSPVSCGHFQNIPGCHKWLGVIELKSPSHVKFDYFHCDKAVPASLQENSNKLSIKANSTKQDGGSAEEVTNFP